jgi:hypothetical protein
MLPMNMPLYTRDRERERSDMGTHLQGQEVRGGEQACQARLVLSAIAFSIGMHMPQLMFSQSMFSLENRSNLSSCTHCQQNVHARCLSPTVVGTGNSPGQHAIHCGHGYTLSQPHQCTCGQQHRQPCLSCKRGQGSGRGPPELQASMTTEYAELVANHRQGVSRKRAVDVAQPGSSRHMCCVLYCTQWLQDMRRHSCDASMSWVATHHACAQHCLASKAGGPHTAQDLSHQVTPAEVGVVRGQP